MAPQAEFKQEIIYEALAEKFHYTIEQISQMTKRQQIMLLEKKDDKTLHFDSVAEMNEYFSNKGK